MDMNLKKLTNILTKLSKKYPNASVYIGRKDGSGLSENTYLIGEYLDYKHTNHRCFCVGGSFENSQELEDDGVVDFDEYQEEHENEKKKIDKI